nr:propionate kinase [Spirochaeta sp.]
MEELGIKLDNRKNYISMTRDGETLISAEDSRVKIFAIPTDEELVMTEDTY